MLDKCIDCIEFLFFRFISEKDYVCLNHYQKKGLLKSCVENIPEMSIFVWSNLTICCINRAKNRNKEDIIYIRL